MADFYDDMRAVATDLIGEFKQGSVEYVAVTPGTGPADDPGASVEIATPINAVARGVKFKYVNGTSVVTSDMQVTMPAGDVVPDMKGFIRGDGVPYKIIQIDTKPPFGKPVVHVIIFRK